MFTVYTMIFTENGIENWFYGNYADEDKANEVALGLGNDRDNGIYHCVCNSADAKDMGIKNLP